MQAISTEQQVKISALLAKGIHIPNPASIEIGPEVDVARISGDNVALHAGCKIYGADTLIMAGSRLGAEAPVTVDDCYIGPEVALRGGYFQRAVFFSKARVGSGAHVREGTILEEQASAAHAVGLKQTILFPFVTLGSLINFCDCLMAGGTSREDHSEVGSSYIHFNYTPNQDKATASLLGDVPHGVMLDQRPIFLGGQGGLVGPCRLTFGTIVAAGSICRRDELRPDRLVFDNVGKSGSIPFTAGHYRGLKRIVLNNLNYIGNLLALWQWYQHVRSQLVPAMLLDGACVNLQRALNERINRVGQLADRVAIQPNVGGNIGLSVMEGELVERWSEVGGKLAAATGVQGDLRRRDRFLSQVAKTIERHGRNYLPFVHNLSPEARREGCRWLQSVVTRVTDQAGAMLPSFAEQG